MPLQLEAILEQCLEHQQRLIPRHGARRLRLNIKASGLDPGWAAGHFEIASFVRRTNQDPKAHVASGKAPARREIDGETAFFAPGVWFYRRYFKGRLLLGEADDAGRNQDDSRDTHTSTDGPP